MVVFEADTILLLCGWGS